MLLKGPQCLNPINTDEYVIYLFGALSFSLRQTHYMRTQSLHLGHELGCRCVKRLWIGSCPYTHRRGVRVYGMACAK